MDLGRLNKPAAAGLTGICAFLRFVSTTASLRLRLCGTVHGKGNGQETKVLTQAGEGMHHQRTPAQPL